MHTSCLLSLSHSNPNTFFGQAESRGRSHYKHMAGTILPVARMFPMTTTGRSQNFVLKSEAC